ncbi:hypothetical protein [Cupriavidus metallidurans]|uniref:hypothetical protein n=1 Tax=Cupriavidus metallidurans TaxID=119219 RepID=UPI001CCE8FF7|nr:hypothetical protein [Cupriavidus metallidurans]UBM12803.1 hypothetical protein LAI70_28020 [Cupriavidus metallidurans]
MKALIDAARAVVASWEKGDLAGAVNDLDAALQELPRLDAASDDEIKRANLYAGYSDEIEFQDEAPIVRADGGFWIAPWMWVPTADSDPDPEQCEMLPQWAGLTVRPHFFLLQEGGSSTEHYAKGFDSEADAQIGAAECSRASYRTSPVIEVPGSLASHPEFYSVAEQIAQLTDQYEYADESVLGNDEDEKEP